MLTRSLLSRPMWLACAVLGPSLAHAEDAAKAPPQVTPTAAPAATTTSAVPPSPTPTAACRAPQATHAKPGERWSVDTPSGQAADWAAWMTEQLAAGRTNFIAVPFKPTGKDSDGSDGPPDNPLQILCAW